MQLRRQVRLRKVERVRRIGAWLGREERHDRARVAHVTERVERKLERLATEHGGARGRRLPFLDRAARAVAAKDVHRRPARILECEHVALLLRRQRARERHRANRIRRRHRTAGNDAHETLAAREVILRGDVAGDLRLLLARRRRGRLPRRPRRRGHRARFLHRDHEQADARAEQRCKREIREREPTRDAQRTGHTFSSVRSTTGISRCAPFSSRTSSSPYSSFFSTTTSAMCSTCGLLWRMRWYAFMYAWPMICATRRRLSRS